MAELAPLGVVFRKKTGGDRVFDRKIWQFEFWRIFAHFPGGD
jgi:hypothetical protein